MNDQTRVTGAHARQAQKRLPHRVLLIGLCLFPIVMTIGCDSLDNLLEVEVPGFLVADDLNAAALAETLVLGVQTDFECAFGSYVWATSTWTDEFWYGGATNNEIVYGLRLQRLVDLGQQTRATACTTMATYLPLHTARQQAVVARELIEGFETAPAKKDFLLAKARVFEAYSYLLLGEAYCQVTVDGQVPPLSRDQTWSIAKTKFSEAASLASSAGSDGDAIGKLALVGRARTNLNLGDMGATLADANAVPNDFVYNATFDATPYRRTNTLVTRSVKNNGSSLSVHSSFHDLEVGGVSDPRTPSVEDGLVFLGSFPMYRQLKYATNASPMPIGTGREAQLMAAEAAGGAAAVTIINNLRATVSELDHVSDSHAGLPAYTGGTTAAEIKALVIEERRRELFLQGHRIGDKLRYSEAWETGNDPHGRTYGPLTCIPLHEAEIEAI